MATRNDVTGDSIASKPSTDAYRDGWDRIFGKAEQEAQIHQQNQNKNQDDPNDD